MRLLHTTQLQLKYFVGKPPEYVILSHRWEDEEVTFEDLNQKAAQLKKGYKKILGTCALAARDEYDWVWIDSCCIDKSSSSELQESINAMFKWYENANISDGARGWTQDFAKSKWFSRGWTLQELIAPRVVEFYANNWTAIGSKWQRVEELHEITGIPKDVLVHGQFSRRNAAERFSWAAHRQVSREEDASYSLLGLFGINMPMLYGEGGGNAFKRLMQEVFKRSLDQTIFLYTTSDYGSQPSLLADSVEQFCQVKQCPICPSDRSEIFPKNVPYYSLNAISFGQYTKAFGVSQVNQELVYVNSGNVLAPLRMVLLYNDDKESFRTQTLKDHNKYFTKGAAILRVKDNVGRWICIEVYGPKVNPYSHALMRAGKTYFMEEKNLPARVNEELVLVHNPSRHRARAQLLGHSFLFTFKSHDFEFVHWRLMNPGQDFGGEDELKEKEIEGGKMEEDEGEESEQHQYKRGCCDSKTISLSAPGYRYHRGYREINLYTKFKGHKNASILIIIRRLVFGSAPCIHAEYIPGLYDGQIVRPNYAITTDRYLLQTPDGARVLISLRQKPSLNDGSVVTRRYEIMMALEHTL